MPSVVIFRPYSCFASLESRLFLDRIISMQPAVCPRCRNPTSMPPPSNCATCGEPFKKAVVIPLTPAIGTSGPRVARLAGRLADGKVGDFTLGEKTTLGRHPNNAMRLLDREVSKEHAVIQKVAGSY